MTSQPDIDPILSDSDACDLSWFFLYLPNSRDKRTIIHCADCILTLLKINIVLNKQNLLSQLTLSEYNLLRKLFSNIKQETANIQIGLILRKICSNNIYYRFRQN